MRFLNHNDPPKCDNPLDFSQGKACYSSLLMKLCLTAVNIFLCSISRIKSFEIAFFDASSEKLSRFRYKQPIWPKFATLVENMPVYTRAKFEVNQLCAAIL